MPTTPIVSIVLPVCNAQSTLMQTIKSIQRQSLKTYEVIAIDDGSTDESVAMLKQWSMDDERVHILSQPRMGIVAALNRGMGLAKTDLIARMDADDVMHPLRLEKQIGLMQSNPNIDLVASRVTLFPKATLKAGYKAYIDWQNGCVTEQDINDEIYVESPFAHPSVLFKKSVVTGLGGYRQGDFPEDYDLWLRMMQSGCRMTKHPDYLLQWRESENRTSRIDQRYSRASFDKLRSQYLARDVRLKSDRALVYWGAGRKTRKRSGLLIEKGFFPDAWIDIDKRKNGNRIHQARVVEPEWLTGCKERPYVLSYVTNHGAREWISNELHRYGFQRGQDYMHVG